MLLDTNILYSLFFGQNDYQSSYKLLEEAVNMRAKVYITQFGIYSLAMGCVKKNKMKVLDQLFQFLREDIFSIIAANNFDIPEIFNFMKEKKLDFDDAMHAFLAQKHKIALISFDEDFKQSDIKAYSPSEYLQQ